MSRAEQAELNIAREHRLHSAPGDNVDQLRIEIVFAEDPLLLGDPERHRIAPDGAVGEHEFRRRFSGATPPCNQTPQKNYDQPSLLHLDPGSALKRLELFERFERLERIEFRHHALTRLPWPKRIFFASSVMPRASGLTVRA